MAVNLWQECGKKTTNFQVSAPEPTESRDDENALLGIGWPRKMNNKNQNMFLNMRNGQGWRRVSDANVFVLYKDTSEDGIR